MHKILYAINHRATEEAITKRIQEEYMAIGAVTYKEAILDKLKETGADTLLIRDTLPGTMPLESLMKRVRVEFPSTRVVVICSERPKQDPFLQSLVNLAIYDIINSDKPTLTDICSYILTPRSYRDAAQYGIGLPEVPKTADSGASAQQNNPPAPPANTGKKKSGFMDDVLKGFKALKKPIPSSDSSNSTESHAAEPAAPVDYSMPHPQVNVDLLRQSIKESEARKAQEGLDTIIRQAVEKETAGLLKENESLRRELDAAKSDAAVAQSQSAGTVEELNTIRSERDKLSITLNDTRRDMQAVIDMYESQLKALHDPTNTPEWYTNQSNLWASEKANLTKSLEDKTKEAEELSFKVEILTRQTQESSGIIADLKEQVQRAQDMQLSERGSDELIAQLRADASQAKGNEMQLRKELETVQAELNLARQGGPDFSRPLTDVPLLPDDSVYTASSISPQTILMLGSKHGVGNTTVALSLACSLASRGYKTLLVEINSSFPMLNEYFELTHIPYGFDEAITSIASGDMSNIDKAIIRPHGLRPTQTNLYKTYKKLPAGLHFLLFSNESLVNHSYEKNHLLTEATVYTFLSYLTKRQQYSHVILDIQCDDHRLFQCLLNSGYQIDKLCMTLTQDPHAVATAGNLITTLSRAHAASLVAGGEFIINRFNPNAPVTQQKIEKMLHLSSAQISKFTEDSTGYLAASGTALPYLLNKGRFWMEYDVLRGKIFPNS